MSDPGQNSDNPYAAPAEIEREPLNGKNASGYGIASLLLGVMATGSMVLWLTGAMWGIHAVMAFVIFGVLGIAFGRHAFLSKEWLFGFMGIIFSVLPFLIFALLIYFEQ